MNTSTFLLWSYRKLDFTTFWSWGCAIVMIASVWFVPIARSADFARWMLILGGVVASAVIIFGTWSTIRNERLPTSFDNMWVPIRCTITTAMMLPMLETTHGPISLWQAMGFWLKHVVG